MKIAFVSQPFEYVKPPIESGSIPIWTYQVIKAWPEKDDNFIIYSNKSGQAAFEIYEGVEYRRFSTKLDAVAAKPSKIIEKLLRFPRPKRPYFSSVVNYFGYIFQISLDIRKRGCDIVHVHNFSQFVPIIRLFNPNIKIVLHMHCEWLSQLDHRMIKNRIEKSDLVIGCSEYVINKVKEYFPKSEAKAFCVYNGVNLDAFSPSSPKDIKEEQENIRLLYVGRVSPEKGIHILLDAFRIICEIRSDVRLDIVGSFGAAPYEYMVLISDDPRVNSLASYYHGVMQQDHYYASLSVQLPPEYMKSVNFVGRVPHSEIVNYYHKADVLVNPSFTEAFGMSLVEAMACRVPVVVTRIGGMVEIIEDSQAGIMVDAGDSEALAGAILRVVENRGFRESLVQSISKSLQKYTWPEISAALYRHYSKLLSEGESLL